MAPPSIDDYLELLKEYRRLMRELDEVRVDVRVMRVYLMKLGIRLPDYW